MPGVASPARRSLERVALLGRGFALLLGAIAGGQTYAQGSGAMVASCVGFGIFAAAYAALLLLIRRYRCYVEAALPEPPAAPRPRRPAPRATRRRVLTDSDTHEP